METPQETGQLFPFFGWMSHASSPGVEDEGGELSAWL